MKEVEVAGLELIRVKASHHQFRHTDQKLPLTMPPPKKD
ncbi:type II toxin-antitoxin system HicA family toxin [Candidatus Enterovibrio escicola]